MQKLPAMTNMKLMQTQDAVYKIYRNNHAENVHAADQKLYWMQQHPDRPSKCGMPTAC